MLYHEKMFEKTLVSLFIKHIESKIYHELLIYRSLIVTKDHRESTVLAKHLNDKDYTVLVVNVASDISHVVDYDKIDERIVIISQGLFKDFIDYLNVSRSSYNLIAFTYSIADDIAEELTKYYSLKTHNYTNDTIIYTKNNICKL